MSSPNIDLKTLLSLLSVFKKLSFFKNNLALLVPIGIAMVAGLLFIPTTLLSSGLRKAIQDKSVRVSQEIDRLTREVGTAAQAEALGPYRDAYAQDANAMDNRILQTTQRELISYRLFPDDPNETSQESFRPFQHGFLSGVDAMLQSLNAGSPPTDQDINTALENAFPRSASGSRVNSLLSSGGTGPGGRTARLSVRNMSAPARRIVNMVCEDRARSIKVYASAVDVDGYLYWSTDPVTGWKFDGWDKALKDAWYWQMAYWMLEDVVTTVRQMNEKADNVRDASVKRIVNVLFTQSQAGRTVIGGRRYRPGAKDRQTPTYAMNVKTAMTGTPCTGRFCNDTYYVMQFDVRVIVKASDVMAFMQELCRAKTHKFRGWRGTQPEQTFQHNQITILESQVIPVDLESPEHSIYEYGPEEVVDMDLLCEYVFNKAAFEYMPGKTIVPQQVLDDLANGANPAKK
jgi:hypothetical protein